ncbi:MAG: hypothetical protein KJO87_01560, partial [Acidimicrobiia bacterium]|nr:hypothetical protein [Acidimicrobiia bacterium]
MKRTTLLVACLALVVAACGESASTAPTTAGASPSATTPSSTTTLPSDPDLRYVAFGTVLDKAGVGPHLCTAVADSLPPQCSGLPIVGLDWNDVPWAEQAGDTTWATARVAGTFDGTALVLTEPPAQDDPDRVPYQPPDVTSPCPEPDGGWVVTDATTATDEAFEQARRYAGDQPGFAGLWVDNLDDSPDESTYGPASYVANFSFIGDLDLHRAALSDIYGGPLCVSEGVRPLAELSELQDEVFDAIFTPAAKDAGIHAGFGASGSSNQFTGRIEVSVMAVTGDAAQA